MFAPAAFILSIKRPIRKQLHCRSNKHCKTISRKKIFAVKRKKYSDPYFLFWQQNDSIKKERVFYN